MGRMSTVKLRSCVKVLDTLASTGSQLTGNRLYWSVGSGCGCYCTQCYYFCCCCGGGDGHCGCCWKRNCIAEKETTWFAFFGQQAWSDLHNGYNACCNNYVQRQQLLAGVL